MRGYKVDYKKLTSADDMALAHLIRRLLKAHSLDIPGTVYFDEGLEHLSEYYSAFPKKRLYYVLKDGDKLIGGIGISEFPFFEDCCELQKLYLDEDRQGSGLSYEMISFIEDEAKRLGYKQIYLETHTNLEAAIHVYENSGYKLIDKPESVMHGSMNRFYLKKLC